MTEYQTDWIRIGFVTSGSTLFMHVSLRPLLVENMYKTYATGDILHHYHIWKFLFVVFGLPCRAVVCGAIWIADKAAGNFICTGSPLLARLRETGENGVALRCNAVQIKLQIPADLSIGDICIAL